MFVYVRRLHLHQRHPEQKQPYCKLPPVSLLKPLKGVDPNLISNLETFFTLDYPKVLPTPLSNTKVLPNPLSNTKVRPSTYPTI